jgi:hypothetical protein
MIFTLRLSYFIKGKKIQRLDKKNKPQKIEVTEKHVPGKK